MPLANWLRNDFRTKMLSNEPVNEQIAVTGQLIIAATAQPLLNGTVHIYLEDVSYADSAATTIAEVQLTIVKHPAGGAKKLPTILPFVINLDEKKMGIDSTADYSLRVWVDANGDGKPSPGDLFSDQSYPVLTHGFGSSAVITLM